MACMMDGGGCRSCANRRAGVFYLGGCVTGTLFWVADTKRRLSRDQSVELSETEAYIYVIALN